MWCNQLLQMSLVFAYYKGKILHARGCAYSNAEVCRYVTETIESTLSIKQTLLDVKVDID